MLAYLWATVSRLGGLPEGTFLMPTTGKHQPIQTWPTCVQLSERHQNSLQRQDLAVPHLQFPVPWSGKRRATSRHQVAANWGEAGRQRVGRPLFMTASFDLFTPSHRSTAEVAPSNATTQPTNADYQLKLIRTYATEEFSTRVDLRYAWNTSV